MAPKEIVRRWDARMKREAAAKAVKQVFANDNAVLPPTGEIISDGEPLKYWLPPGTKLYEPGQARDAS